MLSKVSFLFKEIRNSAIKKGMEDFNYKETLIFNLGLTV